VWSECATWNNIIDVYLRQAGSGTVAESHLAQFTLELGLGLALCDSLRAPPEVMWSGQSVIHSVCVCRITAKVIGHTRLTFGGDPDHFSTSLTFTEWGILGNLLAFLIQSPADFHDTWQNHCDPSDIGIRLDYRSNPWIWIQIPDHCQLRLDASAEVCALWT